MAMDLPHEVPNPFSDNAVGDVYIPSELDKGQRKAAGVCHATQALSETKTGAYRAGVGRRATRLPFSPHTL